MRLVDILKPPAGEQPKAIKVTLNSKSEAIEETQYGKRQMHTFITEDGQVGEYKVRLGSSTHKIIKENNSYRVQYDEYKGNAFPRFFVEGDIQTPKVESVKAESLTEVPPVEYVGEIKPEDLPF